MSAGAPRFFPLCHLHFGVHPQMEMPLWELWDPALHTKGAGRAPPTCASGNRQTEPRMGLGNWQQPGNELQPLLVPVQEHLGIPALADIHRPESLCRSSGIWKRSPSTLWKQKKYEFTCPEVRGTLPALPPILKAAQLRERSSHGSPLREQGVRQDAAKETSLSRRVTQNITVRAPRLKGGRRTGKRQIRISMGIKGTQSVQTAF